VAFKSRFDLTACAMFTFFEVVHFVLFCVDVQCA